MSTSTTTVPDVLNAILGVNDDDPIVAIRNQKPSLVSELQDYYLALFEPTADSAAALPLSTRTLVAVRVASHTGSEAVASWYRAVGREAGVPDAEFDQVSDVNVPADGNDAVSAAIRHTDLLTLRPADATPDDLQDLKHAGYAPAGIVSLSQTIAFVNYQLRLAAALRALGGAR